MQFGIAMTKGKKTGGKRPPAAMPLRVRKHIDALGMDLQQYSCWCHQNGFAQSTDKTAAEIEEEAERHRELSGHNERIDRVLHNPHRLIEAACANAIDPNELSCLKWAEFINVIAASNQDAQRRAQLRELLTIVEDHADFLFEQASVGGDTHPYAAALVNLNEANKFWLRPLGDWRPAMRSRRRQFSSLLRHLLAEYPVPEFMDAAWFGAERIERRAREWFIHIGRGGNIRSARTPFPLTKRMAHHFLEAPESYTPAHALRWGQVHGLGGDRRLTEALLGSRLGDNFDHSDFWQSVIQFFINNPLLDRSHVGPIIDYLLFQKFDVQEVMLAPQVIERVPPPQPNFTMRGRTPVALLRQVEAWHADLSRSRQAHGLLFTPFGIKPFVRKAENGKGRWVIRELLSGSELIKEGKALNHCVATYADSCARGYCSIWTMERETDLGSEKVLTIEVQRHGMIVQVRGRSNRLPTNEEFAVIRQWAHAADLSISNYVQVLG